MVFYKMGACLSRQLFFIPPIIIPFFEKIILNKRVPYGNKEEHKQEEAETGIQILQCVGKVYIAKPW